MSKIIFNYLTILFIADTGRMAPIYVRILSCTLMEIIDGPSIVMAMLNTGNNQTATVHVAISISTTAVDKLNKPNFEKRISRII
jgi:hypothetical protein